LQRKKNIYDKLELSSEEIKNALIKILALKKNGAPILYSDKAYKLSLIWPDHSKLYYWDETPDFQYAKCYSAKMFYQIDSDSSVYPCSMFFDSFKAKKILEVGLEEAFANARQKNLCTACSKPSYIEHNLIYGFDYSTIFSNIVDYFKYNK